MPKIFLICGGAGYIGSHMVKQLSQSGHKVIVLDNLSTGFEQSARFADELIVADLADVGAVRDAFTKYTFDGVMHFAAASLVGESVSDPGKYYRNNLSNTVNLLEVMVEKNVNNFVFSSTAAVFGEPQYIPIDEIHPKNPINPYGASKLMVERVLQDYASTHKLHSVSLRYFNACGADPEGELGEMHDPETHLIPLILQAGSGRRENIDIYGSDYPTSDGTCIRDYIHVSDLCDAHWLAISKLFSSELQGANFLNLGNGDGFSVKQVIEKAKDVVSADGKQIQIQEKSRRDGDPAILVADSTRAKELLGWEPKFCDLEDMISHAWSWEKSLNQK